MITKIWLASFLHLFYRDKFVSVLLFFFNVSLQLKFIIFYRWTKISHPIILSGTHGLIVINTYKKYVTNNFDSTKRLIIIYLVNYGETWETNWPGMSFFSLYFPMLSMFGWYIGVVPRWCFSSFDNRNNK